MSRLESTRRTARRFFTSILFFVVLGLALGVVISILFVPKPNIAVIPISGPILGQAYTNDILEVLRRAHDDRDIKAVVLQIDSPGGGAVETEQIYLEVLRLRQQKPVVVSVGTIAASGGYYIAIASDFIYAQPTSLLGSVGAWMGLPSPEEVDEEIITSGLFKATGISKRKAFITLDTFRKQFVYAVISQRGERLKLSEVEVSQAELYTGTESLRYGLIDDIGTSTAALGKAASMARIKRYGVVEFSVQRSFFWLFGAAELEALKSKTGLIPAYYYLYFESE